jgi:flagellar M-ring protein FliF
MRDTITRTLARLQGSFGSFTAGQKVVAVIGTIALALGGFMVFRWAAAPTYTPLFSNLAPADASAIVDQLTATGVPYEIGAGGGTIMVPSDKVYDTRIALSGEGLPKAAGEGGYSILDGGSISTSQFQEQTSFKRAMEGELSKTIEGIDGVDTAVVHLAIPAKEVFADEQDPTTASILVDTGSTPLDQGQVQAVVNLVSASIDGLEPDKVTVADSTGRVLTVPTGGAAGAAQAQTQQVADFEAQRTGQVQTVLDRVFGAGNATAQVTADLNFDEQVTDSLRYFNRADTPLSSTTSEETLDGGGTVPGGANGVVGPEGNVEPAAGAGTTGAGSAYTKKNGTSDMALDQERQHVEAAPGQVEAIHVSVVVDTQSLKGADLTTLQNNIAAGLGLDPKRGDTVDVATMAFDRTAQAAASKELAAAAAADKKAQTMSLARNGGLVLLVVLLVLVAWLQARRKAKARAEATSFVVEQLRREALERQGSQAALEAMQSPRLALESAQNDASAQVRDEIAALVERQPEDVAALLRGWLVETA